MSGIQEERISKMLNFPYGSYLMVRLEYVIICGDELEAKILRLIEMRMEDERKRIYRETLNAAPKGSVQPENVLEVTSDVWVAISHRTFMYDLYGTVKSENTLKRAIKSLKAKKLIFIRDGLTGRYDSPEYQLNVSLVQAELNKLLKEGKRGYQKLTPSKTDTLKNRHPQELTPSEGQELTPSTPSRVSEVDTNSRNNNSNNNTVEESTLPALATSPTASSDDEDAHALSCSLCSEQDDIHPCRECGTRLCFEHRRDFPSEAGPTRILCRFCLEQHNRMMVEIPSADTELVSAIAPANGKAEPLIASSTTPTAEPAPPKAARKPRAPKAIDDGLQARIERVYAFFDTLGQEVTEDSDYHYKHSKKASEAIVEWLKSSPTEAILREVYLKLWNMPADTRSGFNWRDNMSIAAVLGQYDRMALAIKAQRKNVGASSKQPTKLSAQQQKTGADGFKVLTQIDLMKMPLEQRRAYAKQLNAHLEAHPEDRQLLAVGA